MPKKILSLLLTVVLLFTIAPVSAFAFDFVPDYLSYIFSYNEAIITGCSKAVIGEAYIPSKIEGRTVTTIWEGAFIGCNFTKVVLPDTLTTIGKYAFSDCTSLFEITIPNSVTSIGTGAFYNCSTLWRITIPDKVTSIKKETFSGCTGLAIVETGKGVTSIDTGAFYMCSNLKQLTLPDSITSIGTGAFYMCSNLQNTVIPAGVITIKDWAFGYCESFTSINLPDSVKAIGSYAFFNCSSVKSITIPKTVTSIGNHAFGFKIGPELLDGFIIYGKADSVAKKYADAYNIEFIDNSIVYTVNYNANGGTGTMSSSSHIFGAKKALNTNKFTRTGYEFIGWSTNKKATTATYTNKQFVKNLTSTNGSTVTLYAIWKPITYKVSYNANGGNGIMSNSTHTYGTGKALTANIYTRTGYTFLGWSKSKTATTASYTDKQVVKGLTGVQDKTVILYAVWKPITYKVAYNANGGTGTMANSSHTFGVSKALSANKFTRTGYTFAGWSKTKGATTASYADNYVISSGLTGVDGRVVNLYAVWKPITYKVAYNANGGTGTMSNSSHTFGVSKALSANKFTRTGYTFAGWSKTKGATTAFYADNYVISSGLTGVNGRVVNLYAVWKPITYSVKYDANGGTGTMANSSHTFGVSKALSANKFTRTGYTFLGWSKTKGATTATYTNKQAVSMLTGVQGKTVTLYAVWQKK